MTSDHIILGILLKILKIDTLVKSKGFPFGVIPAKAGIQFFQ
jgi:hypothetical protein